MDYEIRSFIYAFLSRAERVFIKLPMNELIQVRTCNWKKQCVHFEKYLSDLT